MRQVYFSGALTNADEKEFYEKVSKVVDSHGFKSYLPHHYTDPVLHADVTPQEVYQKDKTVVTSSKLVILFANHPSFGTGMEAQIAVSKEIPILLLYHEGTKVSRMLLGAPSVIKAIIYKTEDEAIQLVSEFLETF